MVSPLHRHNFGSARETRASDEVHCLLLSFSYPWDLTCSTLALQELNTASRLSSSVKIMTETSSVSSEVDSQKDQGHIFPTAGRTGSGRVQLYLCQGMASLDIHKCVFGFEQWYLLTPSYSVLEPL